MDWSEIHSRLADNPEDDQAWTELAARVRPWAQKDLSSRDRHLVDDAVEDTCAEVWVKFKRARGQDVFGGFVLGVYFNVRRRLLRALPLVALEGDVEDPGSEPSDPLDDDLRESLRICLENLPPQQRQAVILRFFDEASYEDVAAAIGVGPGNARQLVFRGRNAIRNCLEKVGVVSVTDRGFAT